MPVQHFQSGDVDIAFLDEGEGEPILLIHGFASNHIVNWQATGWVDRLMKSGRRVIALDVRGHGQSEKLTDPARYRVSLLAADAAALIDHLELGPVDVMGYSMGARIGAFLALGHADKVRSLVIGGMGMALVDGMGGEDAIVAALEAPDLESVTGEPGRSYRKFAEQTGSDLLALAACMRVARENLRPEQFSEIAIPVLVAVGETDMVAGSPQALGQLIPGAEVLVIPRRDHMRATADPVFVAAALDFLSRRP